MKRPLLIAHGGYSAKYEENTLEAYIQALKFSPDVIEMDVCVTKDGVPVCVHPKTLIDKYSLNIEDTEVARINEIKRTDGSSVYVTFEKALKSIKGKISRIQVDIKQNDLGVVDLLMEVINVCGYDFVNAILGIRDEEFLDYVRTNYASAVLLGLWQEPDRYEEFFELGGDIYRLWDGDLNEERVAGIHKLGKAVWVTPGRRSGPGIPRTAGITDQAGIGKYVKMEVDGIIVNDIELARNTVDGYLASC